MGRIPYFLASLASSIPKARHRALRSLLRVSGSILRRAIAWATMVGVVGGKEQPNAECGPAVHRVAVVVGGEEQPGCDGRGCGYKRGVDDSEAVHC